VWRIPKSPPRRENYSEGPCPSLPKLLTMGHCAPTWHGVHAGDWTQTHSQSPPPAPSTGSLRWGSSAPSCMDHCKYIAAHSLPHPLTQHRLWRGVVAQQQRINSCPTPPYGGPFIADGGANSNSISIRSTFIPKRSPR
jgi:hypothetical protein